MLGILCLDGRRLELFAGAILVQVKGWRIFVQVDLRYIVVGVRRLRLAISGINSVTHVGWCFPG